MTIDLGRVLYALPGLVCTASASVFQLPLEEVMKWATNGITHPDDLQHCIDCFMGSVASGEPYDFETRFRRHDGVFRWFQLRGLPLRNAGGDIVRWYGLLTDVDDRKHAEEE